MGLRLENAVVIFDEAHNLVDAVNHIHSADVTGVHLALATHAIDEYTSRFQAVLTGKCYEQLHFSIPSVCILYLGPFLTPLSPTLP